MPYLGVAWVSDWKRPGEKEVQCQWCRKTIPIGSARIGLMQVTAGRSRSDSQLHIECLGTYALAWLEVWKEQKEQEDV